MLVKMLQTGPVSLTLALRTPCVTCMGHAACLTANVCNTLLSCCNRTPCVTKQGVTQGVLCARVNSFGRPVGVTLWVLHRASSVQESIRVSLFKNTTGSHWKPCNTGTQSRALAAPEPPEVSPHPPTPTLLVLRPCSDQQHGPGKHRTFRREYHRPTAPVTWLEAATAGT